MTTQRKIAALYARVSMDEQAQNFSLDSQTRRMLQYADVNGFTVPEEYIFREDFSGTRLDRPELTKLRLLVQQRHIAAVIVFSSDRLTRNPVDGDILRRELRQYGVELHYTTRGEIDDSPESELFSGIEDQFNAYWRNKLLEATKRGRREKAESGIILGQGRDMYGYQKVGRKRETRLEIIPEEAEVVRNIFTWYTIEGLGGQAVVDRLNTQGLPTPAQAKNNKGKTDALTRGIWDTSMLYGILNEEAYAGVFYAYRWRQDGKKMVRRPKEEWIRTDRPELAIIEPALFERTQKMLADGRRRNAPRAKHEFLLSRRVTCVCGYHMVAHSSQARGYRYPYYVCPSKSRQFRRRCDMPQYRVKMVDAALWEWVEALVRNPRALLEGYRKLQSTVDDTNRDALEHIASYDVAKQRYEEKLKSYAELYANKLITLDIMREKKTEYDGLIAEAEAKKAEYEAQLTSVRITDEDIDTIEKFCEEIREELDEGGEIDFATKRRFIEALRITATLGTTEGEKWLEIHWHLQTKRVPLESSGLQSSAWA